MQREVMLNASMKLLFLLLYILTIHADRILLQRLKNENVSSLELEPTNLNFAQNCTVLYLHLIFFFFFFTTKRLCYVVTEIINSFLLIVSPNKRRFFLVVLLSPVHYNEQLQGEKLKIKSCAVSANPCLICFTENPDSLITLVQNGKKILKYE